MKLIRIAAQPPLPAPMPVTEHLSILDQGPVIPRSRKDRARDALGRIGIVPVADDPPELHEPLPIDPGAF